MFRPFRSSRLLAFVALLAASLVAVAAPPGVAADARPVPHVADAAPVVGGVVLRSLPVGLGTSSDFTYDYDDVDMVSRVWESHTGTDPDHGWRVDLDVTVLRGARLSTGAALHDWFLAYEQRDPEPAYRPVRVHGRPGWRCADQVFWLVRPGAAVSVQLDGARWSAATALRTALAADTSGLPAPSPR